MKLKDYFAIHNCPVCNKPIYTPTSWIGQNKDGTRKIAPYYATCLHKEIISKKLEIQVQ
jgi:hypothetical protein